MSENNGVFLALGTFDGLHLGHRAVIEAGAGWDNQRVLLFRTHPEKVLTGTAPGALCTQRKQEALLEAWGVSPLYLDFSAVRALPAQTFFYEVLLGQCKAGALSCGFNYRFGKGAAGDAELLSSLCRENGITLHVAPRVEYGGLPISSTRIRASLKNGALGEAAAMLGRRFSYDFPVVHGEARGRTLGVPTVNQLFPADFLIPRFGVYASLAVLGGKSYPAVTNIGVCPTFGHSPCRSETHIIGAAGDFYGQNPEVELVGYLREEKKFPSAQALLAQIEKDRVQALGILKQEGEM